MLQGRSAPSSAGDPLVVLRHELAHLALHDALPDAEIPRWLDEGYASFAAWVFARERAFASARASASSSPTSGQHSLHRLRNRPCSQMDAPPHSLHRLRCRPCSQIDAPPHSLH